MAKKRIGILTGGGDVPGVNAAIRFEQRTGERVIYQRIAYLMRSGPPDSVDQLVATSRAIPSVAKRRSARGCSGVATLLVNIQA